MRFAAAPTRRAGPDKLPGSPLGCAFLSRAQESDRVATFRNDDTLPAPGSFEVIAEPRFQGFDADLFHVVTLTQDYYLGKGAKG